MRGILRRRDHLFFEFGVIAFVLFTILLPQSWAEPTIGVPTATPAIIAVGTPTVVTITTQITDASLISESVALQRLAAESNVLEVLGKLHDDGLDGDAVAGDQNFSSQVTLNEPNTGEVSLRISAAFTGSLKRVFSDVFVVKVQ